MTETAYAARASHAFVLTETVTVAKLMYQGATPKAIRQRVLVEDLQKRCQQHCTRTGKCGFVAAGQQNVLNLGKTLQH